MHPDLEKLLGAARQQTLAAFEKEVRDGKRDPAVEKAEYRRRRRDYATWLRMEQVPDEAHELAASLLSRHGLAPSDEERETFEFAVTRMLVDLYDRFLLQDNSE